MITHMQLSLADIFTDCQNKFENDKYQFLQLLDNTIDLSEYSSNDSQPGCGHDALIGFFHIECLHVWDTPKTKMHLRRL